MSQLSGLQRDVLSLYRSLLRTSNMKGSLPYTRAKFRQEAKSIKRSDFKMIEHKLRWGHKQLKIMNMEGTRVMTGFKGTKGEQYNEGANKWGKT
mmetsp:Transcript_8/g.13  ORF Transcript_8/g.13 Transcript_8/m.13 type:complete len:94 (-) Transcript_8:8-289(-)